MTLPILERMKEAEKLRPVAPEMIAAFREAMIERVINPMKAREVDKQRGIDQARKRFVRIAARGR